MNKERKRNAWIIFIIIFVPTFGLWFLFTHYHDYSEERIYSNEDEKKAIDIAENGIDYGDLFDAPSSDGTWPNYIDGDMVRHDLRKIKISKFLLIPGWVSYHYKAQAESLGNCTIVLKDGWDIRDGQNSSVIDDEGRQPTNFIAVRNGTDLEVVRSSAIRYEWDILDRYYEDAIVVQMTLDHDRVSGLVAATFVHAYQVIVFDRDMNVVFIAIKDSFAGIS